MLRIKGNNLTYPSHATNPLLIVRDRGPKAPERRSDLDHLLGPNFDAVMLSVAPEGAGHRIRLKTDCGLGVEMKKKNDDVDYGSKGEHETVFDSTRTSARVGIFGAVRGRKKGVTFSATMRLGRHRDLSLQNIKNHEPANGVVVATWADLCELDPSLSGIEPNPAYRASSIADVSFGTVAEIKSALKELGNRHYLTL